MSGGAWHFIVESDLRKNAPQILNVQFGRVSFSAARTVRSLVSLAGLFVKFDAELSRSLEDMEEFTEWEREESGDHRDRM
jgi:hypothetical protein